MTQTCYLICACVIVSMCVLLMLNGARAELDLTLVSSDDEAQRILFLNVHSQQGSFLCMAILGFVAAEPM